MTPPPAESPAGQPFAAGPLSPKSLAPKSFASKPGSAAGGCGKPALIGCGVLVVLLGLAAVVFLLKARDLFGWMMVRFEEQVVANLPDDVSDAERQRLHEAFVAASEAVQSGRADALALQRMQSTLSRGTIEGDGKMTREEVLELIMALEEVAGVEGDSTPDGAPPDGELPTASLDPSRAGPDRVSAWLPRRPADFCHGLLAA